MLSLSVDGTTLTGANIPPTSAGDAMANAVGCTIEMGMGAFGVP